MTQQMISGLPRLDEMRISMLFRSKNIVTSAILIDLSMIFPGSPRWRWWIFFSSVFFSLAALGFLLCVNGYRIRQGYWTPSMKLIVNDGFMFIQICVLKKRMQVWTHWGLLDELVWKANKNVIWCTRKHYHNWIWDNKWGHCIKYVIHSPNQIFFFFHFPLFAIPPFRIWKRNESGCFVYFQTASYSCT